MTDGPVDDDLEPALAATAVESSGTLLGVGDAAPRRAIVGRSSEGLAPGTTLGRFVIERKVGAGGMGEVYAAHDPNLDRRVAIKVLRSIRSGPDAAARLLREAQALAKLSHPNVVTIHEVGEADGHVFLAMQFVEGTTLGEHLSANRRSWDEVVRLYVLAGRGLAAAHGAGLIHRDFKPANVLIDRQGRVAVTDFGVARAADDPTGESGVFAASSVHTTGGGNALSTDMTQAGAVIGTPAFMAPEQHEGRRATAASDQFGFCVSLWQGLFAAHPFVPAGHGEVTSPLEYLTLICEGPLSAPPAGHAVPRRIVRAVTRGLARTPSDRWPSMEALLAELEPRSHYRTAVIASTGVATIGIAAAVWLAVRGTGDRGPTCASQGRDRVATAWSAPRRQAIVDGFAATDRPFASAAATNALAALDQYATRWEALATDACAASAAPLAAARHQCLDRALVGLRAVVDVFGDHPRGELVDSVATIVSNLPSLAECSDESSLAAVGAPRPDQATAVAELQARLSAARARADAGLHRDLDATLVALIADADAVGWAPLRAQARLARGELQLSRLEDGAAVLHEAAVIATEHHLDRDAISAWSSLGFSAAVAMQPDAAAAYAEVGEAMARAVGDPAIQTRVRIRAGRAFSRMRKFGPAESVCRKLFDELRAQPNADWRDINGARDCLIETLVPAAHWDDVEKLATEAIAERVTRYGSEHPSIADYERTLGLVSQRRGDAAEARAHFERARDIRTRLFAPDHVRIGESMADLADYETDLKVRQAMLERAVTIVAASDSPLRNILERNIQSALADLAADRKDYPAMRRHFDRAMELARMNGDRSIDVAVTLVGYGQYLSPIDMEGGAAKLREAISILAELKSPRVITARAALAMLLSRAGRVAEALPVLEETVSAATPANTDPFNLALMKWSLARALVSTGGDKARARAIALEARAGFADLGPVGTDQNKVIDAWLRKHR